MEFGMTVSGIAALTLVMIFAMMSTRFTRGIAQTTTENH
jgi:hypothetical protein